MKKNKSRGIQSTIMLVFSVISISIMLILGIVMYFRFSTLSRGKTIQSTEKLMEQAGENLEDYLVSMRQISDAVYYNVIKENDFSDQSDVIQQGMDLLYEANKGNLRSIGRVQRQWEPDCGGAGCQPEGGSQRHQAGLVYTGQEKMENMHFSTPHIQNLFDDGTSVIIG